MTQRRSKVPIHQRDKLNALLKELEKHNIINQIGSSLHDDPRYATVFFHSLIIERKGDSIECVLEAKHLNSNADQSNESLLLDGLLNLLLLDLHAKQKV